VYIKKSPKQNGRTYLSIVESRRDGKSKHSKTITIQKLGYLDELAKDYPDPIGHFSKVAEQMTKAKRDERAFWTLTVDAT